MLIPEQTYKQILKLMPIICVDIIITYNNKCLLVKRENEPEKGKYWFPGGRINKMETIKEAALRKAKEEVNLNCQFKGIISIEETLFKRTRQMFTNIHTINICCKMLTVSPHEIKTDNLHSEYIWVSLLMAKRMNLHNAVINPMEIVLGNYKCSFEQ
jgi:colanic acid biosynthesis protein WcaH